MHVACRVVVAICLSVWASLAPPADGGRPLLPRHAGLGSSMRVPKADIARGSLVVLVHDVTEWNGSLRHGEVGVVQSVDDSASHGFKRFLVKRPDGAEIWHEQDELQLTRTQPKQLDHSPTAAKHAPIPQSTSAPSCTMGTYYPANVTTNSNPTRAADLAGRAPAANAQECTTTQLAASWLPDQSAPDGLWLQVHFSERMHIKDLTIYKTGVAGLIRRIEGFEPRYDGHKTWMLFDGVDHAACGKLLARMPSLTPWSVDRLHFAIAPARSWQISTSAASDEQGGILSIEVFGLVDRCYPAFVGETTEATKLRKRMEEGFTGCSFSGVSFAEADRRIGGNPEELVLGEGDISSCGDL